MRYLAYIAIAALLSGCSWHAPMQDTLRHRPHRADWDVEVSIQRQYLRKYTYQYEWGKLLTDEVAIPRGALERLFIRKIAAYQRGQCEMLLNADRRTWTPAGRYWLVPVIHRRRW